MKYDDMKINYIGQFGDITGYSVASAGYINSMLSMGVDVRAESNNGRFVHEWLHRLSMKDKKDRITITHDLPNISGSSEIYYTVFEFNTIPDTWDRVLRKCRLIFTPSEYSKRALSSKSVDPSIVKVIHHGIDPCFSPFGPKLDLVEEDGSELEGYTFLFVGEWVKRKNVETLLNAFRIAFKDRDDVNLVLKVRSHHKPVRYLIKKHGTANTYLLDGYVRDMSTLYRSCDCFVSACCGEGWGETMSEAMGCGLPVVASLNSGNTEFMDEDTCIPVEFKESVPIKRNSMQGIIKPWFMCNPPNIYDLVRKMKWVHDNQDEAREIGKRASKKMEGYTWDKATKKMLDCIVDEHGG